MAYSLAGVDVARCGVLGPPPRLPAEAPRDWGRFPSGGCTGNDSAAGLFVRDG